VKFLCGRPGCGKNSIATLQIDAPSSTVSLVDPRVSRDGVPLCDRHADLTTPPMGWSMNDLRSQQQLAAVPTGDDIPTRVPKIPQRVNAQTAQVESKQKKSKKKRNKDVLISEAKKISDDSLFEDSRPQMNEVLQNRRERKKNEGPSSRPSKRREVEEEAVSETDKFPWHHQFTDEDEPKELHADSPLLSRAFRSSVG